MSSKHLQTRRLLNTLQAYLVEVRALLIQQWRAANERPEHFVDHAGVLRDARTGKAITGSPDLGGQDEEEMLSGFGFFDIGANDQSEQSKRRRKPQVGRTLTMSEY
jgi:carnitine O-acetyltransferase